MKKIAFLIGFVFLVVSLYAQNIFVILGNDDAGRYFTEDYGVPIERAGNAFGGTRREYTPGMRVYPNAPNNKYRIYFWGRTDREKQATQMPFYFWKNQSINNWYLRLDLLPGINAGSDFEEFTAEEFQQIINRFPVYIDQQYQ